MTTTPPRLRIAVLGAGRIGSAFAFQLSRVGGHDVTVVARPGSARFEQLSGAGGIVTTKGERAEVRIADAFDETASYDLILVTVLAHQIDALLSPLARSAATKIQCMFNTFDPERLREAIGAERCSFGMPFIQSDFDKDGKLKSTIATAGPKSKMNDREVVEVFIASGIPAVFETDMLLWLRCHVPLGVAFESISVTAVRRGGGATWADSMIVARGMQEGFTLIQRLGYRLYPPGKARLRALPAWVVASMLFAMSRIPAFRDLLATGLNECRALVDAMVARVPDATPVMKPDSLLAMKPSEMP